MRRPGRLTVGALVIGVVAVLVVVRPSDTIAGTAQAADPPGPSSSTVPTRTPSTRTPATSDPQATTGCASTVAALSLPVKLGQLLMVGVQPPTPAQTLALVRDDHVGGLFIGSDDTDLLTDGGVRSAKAASAVPLFVSIDEEGGRVQRLGGPHGPLPSARQMAATMTPAQVTTLATGLGMELRALGVNMDLAPDADVSDQPANGVIGDRSFSNTPGVVTTYAGAFAAGLRTTGVLPVLKHFPGHGHAIGDSHTGPAVTPPLSSLLTDDLIPYRTLPSAGASAVMVGHLEVPGLTGTVPASLSPAAYTLLRGTFGFQGVAMTDDLGSMVAVTAHYDLPTAVQLAIGSGADIALWTTGAQLPQVIDRLTAAVGNGTLPMSRVDQAVTRILAAKGVCG